MSSVVVMHEDDYFAKFARDLFAGGAATAVAKTTVAPIERLKLLLQVQDGNVHSTSSSKPFKGIVDYFVRIPKEEGFLAFWRGNLANVLRTFPMQSLNFAFKDLYKKPILAGVDKEKDFWKFFAGNLLAGGAAGVTGMTVVYPLDFIRTQLASDTGTGSERRFQGLHHCYASIVRSHGILGLYRGYFASFYFFFIYRAAYFGLFDTSRVFLLGDSKAHNNFFVVWALAQACTLVAAVTCYPMDTVRIRIIMDNERVFKNTLHCWKTIAKNEGYRVFYNGGFSNVLRTTGSAMVLAVYAEISKYF
uniref:ADP/ATP translocase n=1 Tax=Plectus sambesii TaxID=2011161 RepID=A0A914VSQ9_9BILA